MRRLLAPDLDADLALHGTAASRAIERQAQQGLPPHTLMRRAGAAVARLALAVAPHARQVWIAAGPGNNGGDGFEAALGLVRAGKRVTVSFAGDADRLPPDARDAFERARAAGVTIVGAADASPAADAAKMAEPRRTWRTSTAAATASDFGSPGSGGRSRLRSCAAARAAPARPPGFRAPVLPRSPLTSLGPGSASLAPAGLGPDDLAIDALLGLGVNRPPRGAVAVLIDALNALPCPVLAVDLPSGLDADTGQPAGAAAKDGDSPAVAGVAGIVEAVEAEARPRCVRARHTLALLTAKPGLHTGSGRELAGEVWLDDLGVAPAAAPDAWLTGTARVDSVRPGRGHAAHKGSYGDVAVVGGAAGMSGAALLAARAAHAAGAGRVWLSLLDPLPIALDVVRPELMWRDAWWRDSDDATLARTVVVCGCGGGDAVADALPRLLDGTRRLVLDADALNAIARDAALRGRLAARAGARRGHRPHAAPARSRAPARHRRQAGAGRPPRRRARARRARRLRRRAEGLGHGRSPPRAACPTSTRPATPRSPPPAPATCSPAGSAACGRSSRSTRRPTTPPSTRRSPPCMPTARRRTGRRWRRCGPESWSEAMLAQGTASEGAPPLPGRPDRSDA